MAAPHRVARYRHRKLLLSGFERAIISVGAPSVSPHLGLGEL
jgi:hypothetical protein